ncbi:MAG TPA: hypothetical protein VFN11_12355 [Ktedonobacterales bacterium]|nr:hypothetical protein [Ktedonobacterales bacterium]
MSAPTPTGAPHEETMRESPPEVSPYTSQPMPEHGPSFPTPPATPQQRKASRTGVIIAIVAIVVLAPVMLCIGAALLAGSFGAFVASRQVEQTATSRFQFAVRDYPSITIFNSAGTISVTSGAAQQVTVVATKHARALSSDAARSQLNGMTVTATPTNAGADINATMAQNSSLGQRNITLQITVPATSNMRVTMNAGTITLRSITGTLSVANTAGTVDLQNVTVQGASTMNVTTGTFRFDGSLAKDAAMTVDVGTGSVAIHLPQATAAHVDASTRVGAVTVSSWAAPIQKSGTGQSATFDLNPQPNSAMTIRVGVGGITLSAHAQIA